MLPSGTISLWINSNSSIWILSSSPLNPLTPSSPSWTNRRWIPYLLLQSLVSLPPSFSKDLDKVHTLQCVSTFDLSSPTIHQFFILTLPCRLLLPACLSSSLWTVNGPSESSYNNSDRSQAPTTGGLVSWLYPLILPCSFSSGRGSYDPQMEIHQVSPILLYSRVYNDPCWCWTWKEGSWYDSLQSLHF